MLSDGFGQANLTPNQLPFTNGATIADYTTRNMFTGAGGAYQEKYMIGNPQVGTGPAAQDYTNYKGTQWEHLYKSRMRADTYPFALVLFDRKGQPSFAQHITDYTMPAQWNNVYTDSRLGGITTGAVGNVGDYMITNNTPNSTALVLDNTPQGNNICPVILGMQFSGIDLTDVLFDEYGNLQISGFAIVAMPRYGSVIGQGLLLNTTKFLNSNGTDGNVTTPMQTSYNWLEQPGATPTYGLIGQLVDNVPIEARPNAFTFECPDGFFDPSIFGTTLSADTIIPVGIAAPVNIKGGDFSIVTRGNYRTDHSPDNSQWCAGYQNSGTPVGQYYPHYYNKYYVALPNSLPYVGANGNYPGGSIDSNPVYNSTAFTANNAFLGNPYSINNLYVNARNVPNYQTGNSSFAGSNLNYSEIASEQGYFPADSNYFQYPQQTGKGYTGRAHSQTTLLVSDNPSTGPGQPNTGLTTASLRVKDWTGATSNYCNTIYYLANYTRQIGQYSITQTLLDNRVYNNIGHFIPINSQTLALAKTSTGSYIFNNVEVYYGDTYVDFFAYNRIEPVYYYLEPGTQTTPNCANQPNSYTDFAISMAFCVESKYNHTMRSGLTWPRYGTEPMNSYCNPGIAATNPDGIWYFSDTLEQNEQFDIQADLNAANTANQYNSLQACFGVVNTDFPLREIYAGPKIDGECYDSFRQFLPLNYQDATGLYGEVTDIEYLGGYNSLYALQRYAFARVLFNERTGIAAGGGDLLTAIANGYQGHQYISTKDGCQHLFSSCNTGKGWYWIDAENGKQNRFAGNGVECISDIHDYHDQITAWTRNYWNVIDPAHLLVPAGAPIRYYDNPSYMGGIISVYDYKNDSLYTTFTPTLMSVPGSVSQAGEIVRTNVEPHTVEFNAKLSQYQSRHGFYPPMYMNLKQSFFSPEPIVAGQIAPIIDQHDEGVRGQIYGVNQPSYLRYDTNPQPFEAKVFDNGRVGVDTENGANRISLVNLNTPITPLQSVVLNNPALDYRPVYREGFLTYPMRGLDADTRMRGTYLIQEYQIDNDGSDTIVRITGQETKYRISDER